MHYVTFSVANLLANFSIIFTYENFITLGLVVAVPVSAGIIIIHQTGTIVHIVTCMSRL